MAAPAAGRISASLLFSTSGPRPGIVHHLPQARTPTELPPTDTGQRTGSSSRCRSVLHGSLPAAMNRAHICTGEPRIEVPWRRTPSDAPAPAPAQVLPCMLRTCSDRGPATGHTSGGNTLRVLSQAEHGLGSLPERTDPPSSGLTVPAIRASERDTSGVKRGLPQRRTFLHAPQRGLRTSTVARRGVKRSCKPAQVRARMLQTCGDRLPATGHTSGGSTPRVLNQAVLGHGSTAFALARVITGPFTRLLRPSASQAAPAG
jgi:hypothetical protein